jgi:hypothetical protein
LSVCTIPCRCLSSSSSSTHASCCCYWFSGSCSQ